MERYSIIQKKVGDTPLQAVEKFRAAESISADTPLAYAGRLDPMASGKLLVLLGEECKQQSSYHKLDKEYVFEVLLGISSDTGDVLGLLSWHDTPPVSESDLRTVCHNLTGRIALPYPQFSSKTVNGKPLHTWTLEGRLSEITLPTKTSVIHTLKLLSLRTVRKLEVIDYATTKIETILPVTEASKALGNDFRRPLVRASWQAFAAANTQADYQIATFRCRASSGTYMRTLANEIAKGCNTVGLAYSINRTEIGRYQKLPLIGGVWLKKF